MKNKKTIKKIKSSAKGIVKNTKTFLKKTNKQADQLALALKKEWKKEAPQREQLKQTTKRALGHGLKIGNDVFETIRKDIKEIQSQKKGKK